MDKAFTVWINTAGATLFITVIVTLLLITVGVRLVEYVVKKSIKTAHMRTWHAKDIEKRQKTLVALFANLWRVIVISVAILKVAQTLVPDVSLAPLFASAGILGVALGFGAQSLVKDFLSGIFIISENQYRVGDIIDIEGASGTVERIGTRSTVLRDASGNVHYFPNGMVQHVINKTMGYSMARFTIDVHPASDMDDIIKIIDKTGKKLAAEEKWEHKIIEAPSFVSVGEFTSTAVSILISGKTQPSDQWSVTAEMRRRLLLTFEQKGIKLGTSMPAFQTPPKQQV
jgi:small conductance mechanosensitive channel